MEVSRRALLRASGSLVIVFALAPAARSAETEPWPKRDVDPDTVDSYLAIEGEVVTLYSGKVELGTGAVTALAQIAAEELSVRFDRISVIQGDTALTPDQGPTYASLTIQNGGMQIRRAAATARAALLRLAATRLNVAVEQLAVHDGVVTPSSGQPGLSYSQLLDDHSLEIKIDPSAPLKDPKDYTVVGAPVHRLGHRREDLWQVQLCPRFQAARHAARPRGPSRVFRSEAPVMERRRLRENPGLCPRGPQGRFFGRCGHGRMGGHSRARRRSRRPGPTSQVFRIKPTSSNTSANRS